MGVDVADHRVLALERLLDVGRRQVLAAGGDDQVLLAVLDVEVAVAVDLADVAGVQPAVDDRRRRRLLVAVVALEDPRRAQEDLTVGILGEKDVAFIKQFGLV